MALQTTHAPEEDALRVKYRCKVCSVEREVAVPDRGRAIDVVLWMEKVGEKAGIDHSLARPSCPSRVIDLLIPTSPDAEYIGAPGSDKAEGELPSISKLEADKILEEDTLE